MNFISNYDYDGTKLTTRSLALINFPKEYINYIIILFIIAIYYLFIFPFDI